MTRTAKDDVGDVFGIWEILPQNGLQPNKRNVRCTSCSATTTKFVNNLKYSNPPACKVCAKSVPSPRDIVLENRTKPFVVITTPQGATTLLYRNDMQQMVKPLAVGNLIHIMATSDYPTVPLPAKRQWDAHYFGTVLDGCASEDLGETWKRNFEIACRAWWGNGVASKPYNPIPLPEEPPAPTLQPGDLVYPEGIDTGSGKPVPALALDSATAAEANILGYLPTCMPGLLPQGPTLLWPPGARGVCMPRKGSGFFYPKQDSKGDWIIDPDTMARPYVTPAAEAALNELDNLIGITEPVDAGNGWVHIYWQKLYVPIAPATDPDSPF